MRMRSSTPNRHHIAHARFAGFWEFMATNGRCGGGGGGAPKCRLQDAVNTLAQQPSTTSEMLTYQAPSLSGSEAVVACQKRITQPREKKSKPLMCGPAYAATQETRPQAEAPANKAASAVSIREASGQH